MSNTQITYHEKNPLTENGSLAVGNGIKKFRFGGVDDGTYVNGVDPTEFVSVRSGNDVMNNGGNSTGSSYLRIAKNIYGIDTESSITSVHSYKMPYRLGVKYSTSQRTVGQQLSIEMVGVDSNGNIVSITPISDLPISGNVSITTNVATINFASRHNLTGNTRVILKGNTEKRLNVGPVYVTVVNATQITVPCTLANGTYTAGGSVEIADPVEYARNASALALENAVATTAWIWTRRNGSSPRAFGYTGTTITATNGTQSQLSPYTDAWNAVNETEFISTMEYSKWNDRIMDGNNANLRRANFNQTLPDETIEYKIRIRAKNLSNYSAVTDEIISIAKTGTTTATVTHTGRRTYVVGDQVQIYGVRDQTNFPNLTAQTAIASIVSPTQFTIVIGTASTTSSTGGVIGVVNGSVLLPGALGFSIQSINRTNNILTVTLNTTASGLLPGEYCQLAGMQTSVGANVYDGMYKVLRLSTTTVELESIGPNFTTINTGGAIFKNTELRIHGLSLLGYTRHLVEMANGRGDADIPLSLPVQVINAIPVTQSTGATISATTGLGGWFIHPAFTAIADAVSTAITSSATTAGIGNNLGNSFQITIPITAVSGTNPTLDIRIEESFDGTTNWVPLYDFQRITATGSYNTPILRATGRHIRYVQTVGGTTPSFTRTITRNILPFHNAEPQRRLFDRAITVNTVNSTSQVLFGGAANNVQLVVNMGAVTTTPPQFIIQGSEDNLNWYNISTPLVSVANSTVALTIIDNSNTFVRAIVSTAGVGATLGYLAIKSWS